MKTQLHNILYLFMALSSIVSYSVYYLYFNRTAILPLETSQLPINDDVSMQTEENENESPNIIHLAFIAIDSIQELMYYQFLAIKSAKVYGKADRVYVYYDQFLPIGKWFNESLRYAEYRQSPYNLTSIYGNPINIHAHRKDILQLLILRDIGGLFIDLDTIIMKPVQPLLDNNITLVRTGDKGNGVGCSFIQAKRSSFVLRKWIESYKTFKDKDWAYHCSYVPHEILDQYGEYATVLDRVAGLLPSFTPEGIKMMFYDRNYDYKDNYATHLWHGFTGRVYCSALSSKLIWSVETSLFCKLRNLTVDEEGARVWTDEMSKECATITLEGADSRVKGLIGHWPLTNIRTTMPKVEDISGNRMHGIVSPQYAYKAKGKEFHNDYFIFRNGDIIYLPMLPESKASNFTLTLRFRINPDEKRLSTGNSSIMSVLFNSTDKLSVYVQNNSLLLKLESNKKIPVSISSSIIISDYSQWYYMKVLGNNENFTLSVLDKTVDITNVPQTTLKSGLDSIWLGRRHPDHIHKYYKERTEIPEGSQIADVKLYDYNFTFD